MPVINLAEAEDTGRINLPADVYGVRILNAEKRTSSKGNPMLVLELELASPDAVSVNGNRVRVAGLQLREFYTFEGPGLARLKKLHTLLGLPMTIDTDALPITAYKGKGLTALIHTEVDSMKKPGTDEPIMNPETGSPIETYNYRVKQMLSRVTSLDKAVL